MFTMLRLFSALAILVPFASALTFTTSPENWHSGDTVSIEWQSAPGDPSVFTIQLSNPQLFRNSLALANNVDTSKGSLTLVLPVVPDSTAYELVAVNIGDINEVFATSQSFAIAGTPESTSASASSSSGSLSESASSTAPLTGSSFSPSATGTLSRPSASGSATSGGVSGASSSASPSPTSFNDSGALPQLSVNFATWAAVGLTAVFGVMTVL